MPDRTANIARDTRPYCPKCGDKMAWVTRMDGEDVWVCVPFCGTEVRTTAARRADR